jgi:CRP-like cAMP-binding protein
VTIDESRLDAFDLFEGLGSQELSFIAANCEELQAGAGSILIQEGQVGRDVYLLESGSVRVFRGKPDSSQDQVILSAPTILGEMAMADPERIRTVSVVAESDLRLITIPIETFLVFVRSYPSLKDKLRRLIAARRSQLAAKMDCSVAA